MQLKIGEGIGDIKFGMREPELLLMIGKPDVIDESDTDSKLLVYNSLRTTYWFAENRLHWIQCSRPDLEIFDAALHGEPIEDAVRLASTRSTERPDSDHFGVLESVSFDDLCLELQFEYGTLSTVCFGHLFDDLDNPIWPST